VKTHYELIVVGAGAGGLNASLEAAGLGKDVLVIEKFRPGGECTWSGCIPSKALIQIADAYHHAAQFGVGPVDGRAVMEKVRALTLTAHQAEAVEVLESAGISYLNGEARFVDAHTVEVEGQRLSADRFVVATGSQPAVPPIPGLLEVAPLTNQSVFTMDELPGSLIVLGAGAIGVELSQAFSRLGVKVSLVEMAERILPREEPELSGILAETLAFEGVDVRTSTTAISASRCESKTHLTVTHEGEEKTLSASRILVALGRKADTEDLGLDAAGVEVVRGTVRTNEHMQTSTSHIYAAGDIVGPYQFSHMGGRQGRVAVRHMFNQPGDTMTNEYAWCTFTHPELARTGMLEDEARARYGENVRVWESNYSDADRAVVDEHTTGKIIVITDAEDQILGASILGERACELLGEIQTLKQSRLPVTTIRELVHPYPGYGEALTALSKRE